MIGDGVSLGTLLLLLLVALAASPAHAQWDGVLEGIVGLGFTDLATTYNEYAFLSETGEWDYLQFTAEFPYSRYMSFHLYNASGIDFQSIPDFQIEPDDGSINPFIAGQNRSATNRRYTLWIAKESETEPPPSGAKNFFRLPPGNSQLVVLRIILPDMNRNATGDVALPEIKAFRKNDLPATLPKAGNNDLKDLKEYVGVSLPALPATILYREKILKIDGDTEIFFYNLGGDAFPFKNIDAAYLIATLPENTNKEVAVFRFQPPVAEDTFANTDPFQGESVVDVRYWSFCVFSIISVTKTCIVDDEFTIEYVDETTPRVTLVVGPESLREAVEERGYTFLANANAIKPGIVHRHILPSNGFVGSARNVPVVDRPPKEITEEYLNSVRAENYMGEYALTGMKFTIDEFLNWPGDEL